MTTWTRPRLVYLAAADAAGTRCVCTREPVEHPAVYRAEFINADTGEVRPTPMCFKRGQDFAQRHGLDFPPWKDRA